MRDEKTLQSGAPQQTNENAPGEARVRDAARKALAAFEAYRAHAWAVHKRDCPGCHDQLDASFCPNEIGDEWAALIGAMWTLENELARASKCERCGSELRAGGECPMSAIGACVRGVRPC